MKNSKRRTGIFRELKFRALSGPAIQKEKSETVKACWN
jgi:hypothetical protein